MQESSLAYDRDGRLITRTPVRPASTMKHAKVSGSESAGYVLEPENGIKCLRSGKWHRARQCGDQVVCLGCNVICELPIPAGVLFMVPKPPKAKQRGGKGNA